jgi:large subunit ribosomal protein L4
MLSRVAEKAGLGTKYLLVLATHNKDIEKAGRNLANAKVIVANQLNVLDLMKYNPIMTKDAFEVIEKTYLRS